MNEPLAQEQRPNGLVDDPRPITLVVLRDPDKFFMRTTEIAIEAYNENGEMAFIPWIRVWQNGVVICRFPASNVTEIRYD